MGDSLEVKASNRIIAAYQPWISVLVVSAVAATQDLSLLGQVGAPDPGLLVDIYDETQRSSIGRGLLGMWVRFRLVTATGAGLVFGPSVGSVSGANAPVLANTGVNGATGVCDQLVVNEWQDLWVSVNTRWLGFIGSGAGTLIVRPSSKGFAGG
jgi:hypothetical protein